MFELGLLFTKNNAINQTFSSQLMLFSYSTSCNTAKIHLILLDQNVSSLDLNNVMQDTDTIKAMDGE